MTTATHKKTNKAYQVVKTWTAYTGTEWSLCHGIKDGVVQTRDLHLKTKYLVIDSDIVTMPAMAKCERH